MSGTEWFEAVWTRLRPNAGCLISKEEQRIETLRQRLAALAQPPDEAVVEELSQQILRAEQERQQLMEEVSRRQRLMRHRRAAAVEHCEKLLGQLKAVGDGEVIQDAEDFLGEPVTKLSPGQLKAVLASQKKKIASQRSAHLKALAKASAEVASLGASRDALACQRESSREIQDRVASLQKELAHGDHAVDATVLSAIAALSAIALKDLLTELQDKLVDAQIERQHGWANSAGLEELSS